MNFFEPKFSINIKLREGIKQNQLEDIKKSAQLKGNTCMEIEVPEIKEMQNKKRAE